MQHEATTHIVCKLLIQLMGWDIILLVFCPSPSGEAKKLSSGHKMDEAMLRTPIDPSSFLDQLMCRIGFIGGEGTFNRNGAPD